MSEENNESQGTNPQADIVSPKVETVNIRPMMGADMEFKSFGGKTGNDRGLTASENADQK